MMGYKRKILEARRVSKKRKKNTYKDVQYAAVARQCLNKTVYSTEKKVIEKISDIAEEGRRNLRYYQCPFCDFWHITHKKFGNQEFVS